MSQVRIALIGLGRMGRNHMRTIHDDQRFSLVATVDPFEKSLATEYDARDVQWVSVDCAIIAAPTGLHAVVADDVLGSVPALVEKPLASSFAECKRFARPDYRCVVGHVERFNPAVRALADALARGDIGRPIHFVSTRIGGYPAAAAPENNVALDLAVHDLDVLRHIIGPLRVEASACHATTNPNVCDTAEILLSSQHGASATVHVDWIAPTKVRTLRVTGTEGAAFVDYIAQTCAVVRGGERVELPVERREPLRAQLDAFYRYVTEGEQGLLASAEDGAAAVLLAERALAVSRGGWV